MLLILEFLYIYLLLQIIINFDFSYVCISGYFLAVVASVTLFFCGEFWKIFRTFSYIFIWYEIYD